MKVKSESEVAQSCLTLSDLMDCSLPGSSVHGIFQARVLEWGAIVGLEPNNKRNIILRSLSFYEGSRELIDILGRRMISSHIQSIFMGKINFRE